jgi:hypothetical protein
MGGREFLLLQSIEDESRCPNESRRRRFPFYFFIFSGNSPFISFEKMKKTKSGEFIVA